MTAYLKGGSSVSTSVPQMIKWATRHYQTETAHVQKHKDKERDLKISLKKQNKLICLVDTTTNTECLENSSLVEGKLNASRYHKKG